MIERLQDTIRAASAARKPLRIRGGGSKDWYGGVPTGDVLKTSDYAGVVDYDPAELVLVARCGTPLAEIEALLAERGQMLPFEPPHFGASATLGGCIATGLSGPRRTMCGALRDLVLGTTLMDGRGNVLAFGGQVMKNVAGYDVSRLLAGSLGTLGVILDVSLKVLPKPVAEATLEFDMEPAQALQAVNQWSGQPLPISATAWQTVDGRGRLSLRLSGAEAAVRTACARLGGERLAAADAMNFWQGLREQTSSFFTAAGQGVALWRIALPGTAPMLPLPGAQLIEWAGAQRWWIGDTPSTEIRAAAHAVGGHATLFRNGDKSAGVFAPLQPALLAIHRNLKQQFDPAGIFNPGRMYPEF